MKYIATIVTPIAKYPRKSCFALFALLLVLGVNNKVLAQACNASNLPYSEGFETVMTAGAAPTCTYYSTGVGVVTVATPSISVPHTGNHFLSLPSAFNFQAFSFSPPAIFITPQLILDSGNTYSFTFWYRTTNTNNTMTVNATFAKLASITPPYTNFYTSDTAFFVHNGTNPDYTLATGSFTCTSTGNYDFAIFESDPSGGQLYIDDINIAQATPSVGKPSLNIQGPSTYCIPNPSTGNSPIGLTLYDSTNLFTSGITYQWQSSPMGANTFVNVTGATHNYINAVFTAAIDYRLIATDTATHKSDTSAVHSVAQSPFYNCYCQPALADNLGGGGISPLIDSVSIVNTNLANQTYTVLPNAYTAYPPVGHATTNLYMGSYYTLNVLMNTLGSTAEAWIDYNNDGIFETGEAISMTASFLSFYSTGTIHIPTNLTPGLTGLRVLSGGDGVGDDACGTITTGETEDYIVNILPQQLDDMSAIAVAQPSLGSSVCANSSFTVSVQLYNAGTLPQSNFTVGATYPGNSTPLYVNHAGTIAPGATQTFVIGTMSIPTGGTYTIKAYTSLSNDQNRGNDTAYSTLIVVPLPADPIVQSDTVCSGFNATVGVVPVAGNVYNWYNAPSGGAIVYSGTSQTFPSLTNNITYYVSASTPGINSTQVAGTTSGIQTAGCNGGIMFNVAPSSNLTIDSFDLNFNDVGLQPVSIWYKVGSYVGNQTNNSVWYQLGTTAVNVTNTSLTYPVTVNVPLNLTNGNTYAIYIAYDGQYTPVTGTTNSSFSGPDMTISVVPGMYSGTTLVHPEYATSLCGFFSNPNINAEYNLDGSIHYHLGGSDCESNRIPVTAAVGAAPVVNLGVSDTVCFSPNLFLDAGNPGATYAWNTGDTAQRIHVYDSGTFTYTVVVTKYCVSEAASKLVDVLPLPSVTGINFIQTNVVNYAFSPSGAQNVTGYYWDFGDHTGSNLASPTHTYATAYPYHVRLIVSNNCGADTLLWTVPAGITNVNKNNGDINLYPNPANTNITVNAINNLELKNVAIVNAIGQEVYSQQVSNNKVESIDISKLPAGSYILRAGTTNGTINKVFQVMHQ